MKLKILSAIFLFIYFMLPGKVHSEQASLPIYLEIREENVDNFPSPAYVEGTETLTPPFWVEDGKLVFDVALEGSIAQGVDKQNYNLLIAPANFDPNSAKLLVKHQITYDGKGRNTEMTRYYIFDSFPAQIPFEPVNVEESEVTLGLSENAGKLLNVRLTEDALILLFEESSGKLRCQYGKVSSDLPKDRALELSEKSRKISISKEVVNTTSKDTQSERQDQTQTRNFGEVEFKTKLILTNRGSYPLS